MATILLPPDFKEFLQLLNDHRVVYLLIGGCEKKAAPAQLLVPWRHTEPSAHVGARDAALLGMARAGSFDQCQELRVLTQRNRFRICIWDGNDGRNRAPVAGDNDRATINLLDVFGERLGRIRKLNGSRSHKVTFRP
jgi:hypothetical protein